MFKRKFTYVMEINALFRYPLEELRAGSVGDELKNMPDDLLKGHLANSVVDQVMDAAEEELRRHGQKPKRAFRANGYEWVTGFEVGENEQGEDWVDFTVAFDGDTDGAVAAAESWIQRVEPFGGIEKIRRAALRGTDGTNLQMFDEEIQQMAASLDDETKAQIDQLMDADNPGYGEKSS
jgi:hypothetical protein